MFLVTTLPRSVSALKLQRARTFSVLKQASTETSVTERYVRKTPLEHVKIRPGMYIGSTTPVSDERWVYHWGLHKMVHKQVKYTPGLVKLFDEILVNAADNVSRCSRTSEIRVNIEPVENPTSKANNIEITVWNNGSGVPVAHHSKENLYVPELVFGHLHTGSNFSDTAESFTGGRHGFGAKLTNIFSDRFTVETCDSVNRMKFAQTWNGMVPVSPPSIQPVDPSTGDLEYTKISFVPNMAVFGGKAISPGTLAMIRTRVLDLAGTLGSKVAVYLNDERLQLSEGGEPAFPSYAGLFLGNSRRGTTHAPAGPMKGVVHLEPSDLVEVVVGCSPEARTPVQVSFVNNMSTPRGGSHVDLVRKQVAQHVVAEVNKSRKAKHGKATMKLVSGELALFVNAKVSNPAFDSQMKECLTTEQSEIRKQCRLSPEMLDSILKDTGIVQRVKQVLSNKDERVLHRAGGKGASGTRRLQIPKLEDANLAGGKESAKCTLILTEGDSAKALAVAGIAEVGRDHYGVFPLRGKPLNVRESSPKQIANNEEILNLTKIVGLNFKNKYDRPSDEPLDLRYGRIMLMTDQDYDGSHIKGLLINLFDYFWPALLLRKGFLCEFVTPVIKAKRAKVADGDNSQVEEVSFYSMREFDTWCTKQTDLDKWLIKYYKGLGTSTSQEAKQYFRNLKQHTIEFTEDQDPDKNGSPQIDMCFNKEMTQQRKDWITRSLLDTDTYFDHSRDEMTYDEFINQELVLYSQYDNIRSIPSVVDGLKPSQRKILFAAFQKFKNRSDSGSELKVAQLAGVVSELAAYHHGEVSLHSTIIGMAQDFVGANNLPVLFPSGQFGTRIQGGKDAASARYTFTRLQEYTRLLFPRQDDALLSYNEDDGQRVEPRFFVPIIPMVLVNGANGIGFGWSTQVHPRNPLEVIAHVRARILRSGQSGQLLPWYRGFDGTVRELSGSSTSTRGVASYDPKRHVVKISELPIGRWVDDYRKQLGGERWKGIVDDYNEYHTEEKVHFELRVKRAARKKMQELSKKSGKLESFFALESKMSHNNMHLFDSQYRIKLYTTVDEILEEFYLVRVEMYRKRKELMMSELGRRKAVLENKIRFAKLVANKEIDLVGTNLHDMGNLLYDSGFDTMAAIESKYPLPIDDTGSAPSFQKDNRKDFSHLLNRPIWHLTREKVQGHENKYQALSEELNTLAEKTVGDLWLQDLDELEKHLRKIGFN